MGFFDTIKAYQKKDPSVKSKLEVLIYPGFWATGYYRLAHLIDKMHLHFIARLISFIGRFFTGVEIHPSATIGKRFIIDHGMGIVIGGSAIIGNDVLMYHGVTLGAVRMNDAKRHPTIEDNVIIGAGAIILGDITIGEGSVVAAGATVLSDVPPKTTVVGLYK